MKRLIKSCWRTLVYTTSAGGVLLYASALTSLSRSNKSNSDFDAQENIGEKRAKQGGASVVVRGPLRGVGGDLFSMPGQTIFDKESAGFEVQYGSNSERSARGGGAPQFDLIRGMITNGSGDYTAGTASRAQGVGQVASVAGTIRNLTTTFGVGGFFNSTCEVNGCSAWGVNSVVGDIGPDTSENAIKNSSGRILEGDETDVNIFAQSTRAIGHNTVINTIGRTAVGNWFAYNTAKNAQSQPWNVSYTSGDGAAVNAFNAGAISQSAVANGNSQALLWGWYDAFSNRQAATLQFLANSDSGNVLDLSGVGVTGFRAPNLFLPKDGRFQFANSVKGAPPITAFRIDDNNSLHFGSSSGSVVLEQAIVPVSGFAISLGSNAKPFGTIFGAEFVEKLSTPSSSSSRCLAGQFTDDRNFHYVCVAPNKWKRVALSDF